MPQAQQHAWDILLHLFPTSVVDAMARGDILQVVVFATFFGIAVASLGTRGKPVADIEQGYISTASCILANNALRLGRTLTWDPKKGQVVGDDEANRLLQRPYRQPWVHPQTGAV